MNKILNIIKSSKLYFFENPKKLLFQIISKLIKNKFLRKEEKIIYKDFLLDLSNIGYHFSRSFTSKIKNNLKEYTNINSEFSYYIPTNPNILKGNNQLKIMKHSSCNKIYNDINN